MKKYLLTLGLISFVSVAQAEKQTHECFLANGDNRISPYEVAVFEVQPRSFEIRMIIHKHTSGELGQTEAIKLKLNPNNKSEYKNEQEKMHVFLKAGDEIKEGFAFELMLEKQTDTPLHYKCEPPVRR